MSFYFNISVNDFDKICRTCAARGQVKSLYEKYIDNSKLIEILVKVTFLQIRENDGLPINICVNCENQLIQAYNFAQKCSKIDLLLRECMNENETNFEECVDKDPLELDDICDEIQYEEFKPVEQIKLEELDIKEEIDLTQDSDSEMEKTEKECHETFQPEVEEEARTKEKQVKHINKKVKCKICLKQIAYKHFRQHMRVHSTDKPYTCDICGSRFRVKNTLKNHMVSRHSNHKPYKCNECERVFNRLWNLQSHQRKHTGEKPYICKYCQKDFKYPTSLRVHLKTHVQTNE